MDKYSDRRLHEQDLEEINSMLPNRDYNSRIDKQSIVSSHIDDENARAQDRANRLEIARVRANEKRAIEREGKYDGYDNKQDFIKAAVQERTSELREAVKSSKALQPVVFVEKGSAALGTTKHEVTKLLASLNINLNVQLTRTDTHNLLATLLTCNESQLMALYNNKKIPLAIRAVIKRIQLDADTGDIAVIERLWNRIFGDSPMKVDMPQGYSGILPNQPVSREAYILIRETLLGKE